MRKTARANVFLHPTHAYCFIGSKSDNIILNVTIINFGLCHLTNHRTIECTIMPLQISIDVEQTSFARQVPVVLLPI